MVIPVAVVVILCLVGAVYVFRRLQAARRAEFIRHFDLPKGLFDKLRAQHPHLTYKDCLLVSKGLRQFFLAYLNSGRRYVSMPSQVADDLWHEFILYTRNYESFCRQAFGGFMHHTPAAALTATGMSNVGLRRCWWYVCREELINPRQPLQLPLLFALDAKLNIKDGFHYAADCEAARRMNGDAGAVIHCGGDFSSSSVDGSSDGFGDSVSSDSSGSDGGCGGGGCGGGD